MEGRDKLAPGVSEIYGGEQPKLLRSGMSWLLLTVVQNKSLAGRDFGPDNTGQLDDSLAEETIATLGVLTTILAWSC